jgi:hypothetical protein
MPGATLLANRVGEGVPLSVHSAVGMSGCADSVIDGGAMQ